MDITILRKDEKFLGAYLAPQGLLLDAGLGVGEVIKELGLNPQSALLTASTGDLVAGLDEVFPDIGSAGLVIPKVDDATHIEKFAVGAKGAKRYGYRIKTPDGQLVYAPYFERLEKSKLAGADLAILDPGELGLETDPAGASHRSYEARKRMTDNAGVKNVIWTDDNTNSSWSMVEKSITFEKKDAVLQVEKKKSSKKKSMDMTAQVDMIRSAFYKQFEGQPGYFYCERIYDDHIVASSGYGSSSKTYIINYTVDDGEYTFDDMTKWQEVMPTTVYQPVEKSELLVEKSDDGTYRWMAISSNSFRDIDGEIVTTQAMDFAIEIAKKRGSYGNLVWEHYDELPIGVCKSQRRVGNFLVETGDFLDTKLGLKAAEKIKSSDPGKYRISIGFKYWQGTKSDEGEYYLIDIFHRACTDHPANKGTALEVEKSMKTLTEDEKLRIAKDLDITKEELEATLAAVTPVEKEKSEDAKTALKSEDKKDETPVVDLGAVVAALTEKVKALEAQLVTVPTQTRDEILKSLAGAPKGEITKTTDKGPELTKEEQDKLAADLEKNKSKDAPTGFQSFYDMFTSHA